MRGSRYFPGGAAVALLAGLALGGCMGETLTRGYVPPATALEQI